ncbi:serine hydrolase domain-containing protein [Conexibacter woesei]|uniref:serine hydrolase domain-containing protein n=1 Tax=Conexibacter woesei TaxID=191495 RepID=UPI000420C073|nr:serine hydrolase [Conexibacter woesei]
MTTITINNWQDPNNTWWGYRHIRELIPTARIASAAAPSPLPERLRDGLAAERILEDPTTDGVLVLHDGHVVLERYARGMRPDDVHLMQSVSKSITGTLAGIIINNGKLAPDDLVTAIVPELAGSSFDGATVRDLLDMRAGTRFDETYDDPQSDIRASEAQFRWAPGTPPAADAIAYLRTLSNHREHHGRFEYRSILTDVLGLVLHRAAGAPLAELIGTHLWGPMGAETDAQVTVDGAGFAVADGGICVSLRDLARFGRLVADGGAGIVPPEWLTDTRAGAPDSAAAFAQSEHADAQPGGHYRNQWWVPAGGDVLVAVGIHGQFCMVDHPTRTVLAVQSTWPTSLDETRRAAVHQAFHETVAQLA